MKSTSLVYEAEWDNTTGNDKHVPFLSVPNLSKCPITTKMSFSEWVKTCRNEDSKIKLFLGFVHIDRFRKKRISTIIIPFLLTVPEISPGIYLIAGWIHF